MKRFLTAILVIFIIAFTFSGCFPTGEKTLVEKGFKEYKPGEKFEYSRENLTAEFIIPEKLPTATRIKLKLKTFDREKVLKFFFGDRTYTQGPEEEGMQDIYDTDDGAFHISFSGGGLRFNDERVCSFEYPVNYASLVNYCVPREWYHNPPSDKDLEDFPRETALKQTAELLTELGFENLGEPETYTMTVDAIKAVGKMVDQEKLSKEHECYVFRYPFVFDGIEICDLPVSFGEWFSNDSHINIVLTRENFVFLSTYMALEYDFEVLSEEPVKYGIEYAVNEFKKYHESAYLDFDTIIYGLKPVYYPVLFNEADGENFLEFIPLWYFEGRCSRLEEDGEGEMYENVLRYVALVGSDNGIVKKYQGG